MTIETRIRTGNGKPLLVKGASKFRDMPVGTMFVLAEDEQEYPRIWVKTPFADMSIHGNGQNQNGAFCNAWCLNSNEKDLYIQCFPEAQCFMIETGELFGTPET